MTNSNEDIVLDGVSWTYFDIDKKTFKQNVRIKNPYLHHEIKSKHIPVCILKGRFDTALIDCKVAPVLFHAGHFYIRPYMNVLTGLGSKSSGCETLGDCFRLSCSLVDKDIECSEAIVNDPQTQLEAKVPLILHTPIFGGVEVKIIDKVNPITSTIATDVGKFPVIIRVMERVDAPKDKRLILRLFPTFCITNSCNRKQLFTFKRASSWMLIKNAEELFPLEFVRQLNSTTFFLENTRKKATLNKVGRYEQIGTKMAFALCKALDLYIRHNNPLVFYPHPVINNILVGKGAAKLSIVTNPFVLGIAREVVAKLIFDSATKYCMTEKKEFDNSYTLDEDILWNDLRTCWDTYRPIEMPLYSELAMYIKEYKESYNEVMDIKVKKQFNATLLSISAIKFCMYLLARAIIDLILRDEANATVINYIKTKAKESTIPPQKTTQIYFSTEEILQIQEKLFPKINRRNKFGSGIINYITAQFDNVITNIANVNINLSKWYQSENAYQTLYYNLCDTLSVLSKTDMVFFKLNEKLCKSRTNTDMSLVIDSLMTTSDTNQEPTTIWRNFPIGICRQGWSLFRKSNNSLLDGMIKWMTTPILTQ